jgi:clorobiocin biosynthesis protein CloN2
MRAGDIFLSGIGIYLPEIETLESAAARGLCRADEMAAVGYRGAAVAGDLPAPEMALSAARDALKNSGVSPDDLAALLYTYIWHQGPDGWSPAHYLQRYLVGDDPFAAEVRDGCNGTFSAIELAIGVLRAEAGRKAVLITASDNFGTPLFRRWESGILNTVMGDGASAVVLTKDDGFAQLLSIGTMAYSEMEEAERAGEPLFPPGITEGRAVNYQARFETFGRKLVTERIGERMLVIHQQRAAESVSRTLAEAGIGADDIKRVIIHNIGQGDAASYLAMLGFGLDQSTWSHGREIGHTGASDHLISLNHLLAVGELGVGDHVLLAGMSPGLTYKSAVDKIHDVPPWACQPR